MDGKTKEYNIAMQIVELIKNYPQEFDYIDISFISKFVNKKQIMSQNQNTFFVDKNGKMINGKTEFKK